MRVRVIAPMEFRIAKVQERLRYDKKQAVAYIEKMDRDRRKWTRFLYGVDWEHPSLYDIVIDLAQIDPDAACELICSMARLTRFEFSPQSQKAMEGLAKASHVKAELARNPATWDFQFDVSVQNGSVRVKGDIVDPDQARIVARIARAVTGVHHVDLDQLVLATRF